MAQKREDNLEKEKLLAEIERLKKELKKRKKYGLVWEEKPEEVVEMCKKKLPVLKEVKSKEIITDPNKPVNLLIEGDNYHALSVLNYTHEKKIDVIYIDPPYNTGNRSWQYNNDYVELDDAFRHSKWVSFMESRLKLAKRLLKDTGIILVTIDDYEIHTLGLLMAEIFGEDNSLGNIIIINKAEGRTDDKFIATAHEYMLVYGKNSNYATIKGVPLYEEEKAEKYPLKDSISDYRLKPLKRGGTNSRRIDRPNLFYPVFYNLNTNEISLTNKKGFIEIIPIDSKGIERVWQWGKQRFLEGIKTEIEIVKSKNTPSGYEIYRKVRSKDTKKAKTFWNSPKYNAAAHGTKLLEDILGKNRAFEYPKSLYAVIDSLVITSNSNSIILDFFAGSGTTGHAVLEMNKQDNGNRQFILCTNNENNICTDVCYPRIEKVINGYKNSKGEKEEGLGGNLKYFKTDFVDAEPTDRNKKKLTEQATEMLCIREGTFESVLEQKRFKIFKSNSHYTGIIFDQLAIPEFKKAIKDIKSKFSVYIFSLGDDTFDEEFADMKQRVKLSPIPEAILRVYRRIFR